jgi:glycosyltransferase involved in cell wall biosynthesis
MSRLGTRRVEVLSQVALSAEDVCRLNALPIRQTNPFRLISIGSLLHLKGFHLGLMAFGHFQRQFPDSEYWLIGDGHERQRLERLARRVGVGERVRFFGELSRGHTMGLLAECDVLVHPSLHDSGGWVCVEAMAAGRPVICLDLGGPALQVTEETGIKLPARSPEQTVNDLTQAVLRLARNPVMRMRMGDAARRRVAEQFDWRKKGRYFNSLYRETVTSAE